LRRVFGLGEERAARESVVVLRHGHGRAGLAVDELLGECEAVIKPLGPFLEGLPGIASATILSNGRVALILDAAALLESASARARGGDGPRPEEGP
jgi:two-component system chemotaxis sensor kinase CheA